MLLLEVMKYTLLRKICSEVKELLEMGVMQDRPLASSKMQVVEVMLFEA